MKTITLTNEEVLLAYSVISETLIDLESLDDSEPDEMLDILKRTIEPLRRLQDKFNI